jgi:hypothetical protein
MSDQALNTDSGISWRDAMSSNDDILEAMKKYLGVLTIKDLFKASFINGCGSTELSREEANIIDRDIDRYHAGNILPAYVQSAFSKLK